MAVYSWFAEFVQTYTITDGVAFFKREVCGKAERGNRHCAGATVRLGQQWKSGTRCALLSKSAVVPGTFVFTAAAKSQAGQTLPDISSSVRPSLTYGLKLGVSRR
ncbi:MAG: hypothetical protein WD851_11995 [Pirellulales bacterium]